MNLTTIKTYLRSSVAQNAGSLYLIQFANYLLPLITVPYVVRVLGPSGYGLVAFGTSLVGYFQVLTDYGFGFSATRKISVERQDPLAVSRIAFQVWSAKLLLACLGLLILLLLIGLIPTLRENRTLLLILYGLILGNVLFPTWLFQGMERMVPISVINLIVRLLVVLGIFTLIKRPEDYLWFAALNSLGAVGAGLLGVGYAFYQFPLRPVLPSWQGIKFSLREGWMLFLSGLADSLHITGNAFILGMFTNSTVVGYYSAAEKIVMAILLGIISPLSRATFPRFSKLAVESRELSLKYARSMFLYLQGFGLILSVCLFTLAPIIVNLFLGSQYKPVVNIIRILAFLPLFSPGVNVFGIQILLPFGKDRLFTLIYFCSGIVNLSLAFLLIPFFQAHGMAMSFLASEAFITLAMFYVLWFYEINPFSKAVARQGR